MYDPVVRILYVEPFEGGSHAAFGRTLRARVDAEWCALTLPARHWKWRMRGAAPWFAREHREALCEPFDLVFASAYLSLVELVGLTPALAQTPAVLYFHENQLAFPTRDEFSGERDTHFGFTQLVSSLAATRCVFNSAYNRDSFLAGGRDLLSRLPDAVPPGWIEEIEAKSVVIGLPLELPAPAAAVSDTPTGDRALGPLIVWNHRWEHDKDPESFFAALLELDRLEVPFRVAVCGQRFRQQPPVFEMARARLGRRVEQWGPLPRAEYEALLGRAQLAVSTAQHEFFGISMLEAAHFGAHPLVPDRLAYPELFPAMYRYESSDELVGRLASMCRAWCAGRVDLRVARPEITAAHRSDRVAPKYAELFRTLVATVRC